jgi:hypothetical protein
MDLSERGWSRMGWIDVARDMDHWMALVNTVMNLRVSQSAGEILEYLSDWRLLKDSSPWS